MYGKKILMGQNHMALTCASWLYGSRSFISNSSWHQGLSPGSSWSSKCPSNSSSLTTNTEARKEGEFLESLLQWPQTQCPKAGCRNSDSSPPLQEGHGVLATRVNWGREAVRTDQAHTVIRQWRRAQNFGCVWHSTALHWVWGAYRMMGDQGQFAWSPSQPLGLSLNTDQFSAQVISTYFRSKLKMYTYEKVCNIYPRIYIGLQRAFMGKQKHQFLEVKKKKSFKSLGFSFRILSSLSKAEWHLSSQTAFKGQHCSTLG